MREAPPPTGGAGGPFNSMFTMCRPITPPFTHVETLRPQNAKELNNDVMIQIQLGDVRTKFINSSEKDLINDYSSFCSRILLATDLQCHVYFSFEKLLLAIAAPAVRMSLRRL